MILNLPPWGFINKEGKIDGIHKHILDEIEKSEGLDFKYNLVPLARFVREIESGRSSFGMLLMRESFKDKVQHLAYIQNLTQYLLLSNTINATSSINSLLKLNSELKHPPESYSKLGINLKDTTVVQVTQFTQAFKMLAKNRVDSLLYTSGAFKYFLQENIEYKRSDFGEKLTFYNAQVSFFLVKNSKLYNSKIKVTIQSALKRLIDDGTIQKINDKFINK